MTPGSEPVTDTRFQTLLPDTGNQRQVSDFQEIPVATSKHTPFCASDQALAETFHSYETPSEVRHRYPPEFAQAGVPGKRPIDSAEARDYRKIVFHSSGLLRVSSSRNNPPLFGGVNAMRRSIGLLALGFLLLLPLPTGFGLNRLQHCPPLLPASTLAVMGSSGEKSRRSSTTPRPSSAARWALDTPPGYSKDNKYPVLYLLHGSGDDETGWTTQGFGGHDSGQPLRSQEDRPHNRRHAQRLCTAGSALAEFLRPCHRQARLDCAAQETTTVPSRTIC